MIFTHSLKNTSHKTLKRLIFWGCCLLLGIFIMGYFALDLASDYGEKIERNSLLAQARLAAASVDPTLVKSLKGVPEDVGTQAYQHIRSILTRMIKTNKDLRFIYLMGFKRDQIIFLVDTEPLTSPDFSPPGQVYDEATPKLVDSFTDMISFVEGPYEDRWGVWVSAFVPIIYPENTEVAAVIGLDVDAQVWRENVLVYKWFAMTTAGFIAIITLLSFTGLSRIALANRKLHEEIENRKRAEQETQAGERKLMAMSQASHDAMIMNDSDDRVLFWNPAAEKMFDYTVDEAMGKKLPDLILPSDGRRSIWEGLENFKDTGSVIEAEAIRKDGTLFPTQRAVSAFQMEGQWFAVATVRDATEQKAAEQALKESEEHSRLLLESVGEGILGVDIDGRIIFVNPAAMTMLGYSEEELIGQSMHNLIHHSYPDGTPYLIDNCPMHLSFTTGTVSHERDEVLWRKDGTCFYVAYTSTPIIKDIETKGAMVTFMDIGEQKKAEESLQQRVNELERFTRQVVDREKRMIGLKEEINGLLDEMGQSSKYKIAQ